MKRHCQSDMDTLILNETNSFMIYLVTSMSARLSVRERCNNHDETAADYRDYFRANRAFVALSECPHSRFEEQKHFSISNRPFILLLRTS